MFLFVLSVPSSCVWDQDGSKSSSGLSTPWWPDLFPFCSGDVPQSLRLLLPSRDEKKIDKKPIKHLTAAQKERGAIYQSNINLGMGAKHFSPLSLIDKHTFKSIFCRGDGLTAWRIKILLHGKTVVKSGVLFWISRFLNCFALWRVLWRFLQHTEE